MISFCARWVRAGLAFWPYRRLLKDGPRSIETDPTAAETALEAVFVPGWASNAGVGVPLMEDLSRSLGLGRCRLAPITSKPLPHLEKVALVRDCLEDMLAGPSRGHTVLVIAHSYGGLLAARALLQLSEGTKDVLLVTLNTPFRGPRRGLIRMGRMLGWFLRGSAEDPELAFMRTDSSELGQLRCDLESRSFELRTVMAKEDEFLTSESGHMEGTALEVAGILGHTGLLVRPKERARLVEAVARALSRRDRTPTSPTRGDA